MAPGYDCVDPLCDRVSCSQRLAAAFANEGHERLPAAREAEAAESQDDAGVAERQDENVPKGDACALPGYYSARRCVGLGSFATIAKSGMEEEERCGQSHRGRRSAGQRTDALRVADRSLSYPWVRIGTARGLGVQGRVRQS